MGLWPFSASQPDDDDYATLESSRVKAGGGSADEGQATLAALSALLEPFKGTERPVTARTDPGIAQKPKEPMTITKLYQYFPFFLSQGTSLTKAFWQHHLFGPPKPSWGVELTLFTAFLRESAAYSHLSSLSRLRSVLDLGTLLPTPKDGIVTPISFRVKKRGLTGFLAEADAEEDGKRQITGEWVINRRLWKKMQTEFVLHKAVGKDRVILYLHGGAYYTMSAETHRYLTISISRFTESRVFAINYRLAPETRFPGQLHDAVSAYMRLIRDLKIPPENIVFAGDSAGGGLCVATMMYLRDEGYPLPSGAILMSPSCESWTTNRPYDYLPQPQADDHLHPVKCLLGPDGIHKYLTHPYVSPLFGNFEGIPPLLIQAGDAEVLRDEITLLAHKASLAGVPVEHEIFEDCVHVFQAFLFLEASRKAFQSQRQFVKYKLPSLNKPKDVDFAQMDAEIAADAHPVDQQGQAEPTSLPSSPIGQSSPELGPEPPTGDDERDGNESEVSEEAYDSDRLSDSSGSREEESHAANSSLDSEDSVAHSEEPPLRTQRPILRAYASARDLLMTSFPSTSKSLPDPTSPSGRGRRHHRSKTTIAPLPLDDGEHRPLHARSSSHPSFRDLLEQYAATGPSNDTRVVRTALPSAEPIQMARSRSRTPSFVGESPGFGFL
ncbi:epsilon-lactone hydrolase, partial [Phenoliferia sp. Uapishka_3]